MNKYRKALLKIIKIHDGPLIDGDYIEAIEKVLHPLRVKKCLCEQGMKYAEKQKVL